VQGVASNHNLSLIGTRLGLEGLLQRSRTNPQPISGKMLATAVEAVLGAVYLDGGFDALGRIVNHLDLLDGH